MIRYLGFQSIENKNINLDIEEVLQRFQKVLHSHIN